MAPCPLSPVEMLFYENWKNEDFAKYLMSICVPNLVPDKFNQWCLCQICNEKLDLLPGICKYIYRAQIFDLYCKTLE